MASPHVAGAIALYLQTNPGASAATVTQALVTNSTTGKVTSPGTGSPNRLLYSIFGGPRRHRHRHRPAPSASAPRW